METMLSTQMPQMAFFPLSRKLIEWKPVFGGLISGVTVFPLSRKLIEWKQYVLCFHNTASKNFPLSRKLIEWKQNAQHIARRIGFSFLLVGN